MALSPGLRAAGTLVVLLSSPCRRFSACVDSHGSLEQPTYRHHPNESLSCMCREKKGLLRFPRNRAGAGPTRYRGRRPSLMWAAPGRYDMSWLREFGGGFGGSRPWGLIGTTATRRRVMLELCRASSFDFAACSDEARGSSQRPALLPRRLPSFSAR